MEILGSPLHPLIVHATVVAVRLAVGAIAVALINFVRVRYGELVLPAAVATPILTVGLIDSTGPGR